MLTSVAGLLLGAALIAVGGAAAYAGWTTTGSGIGFGTVGDLTAPGSVSSSSAFSTVTTSWTGVAPPTGSLAGYYVTRYAGSTPSNACGTDPTTPATYLPAGTLTCNDTAVTDGTYTYRVTAVFRSWTSTSGPGNVVTVVGDGSHPSQSVTMSVGASNAYLGGATVYFRSAAGGSFTLTDTVNDTGSGPASATFPAVTASGWTHAAETVSAGTGTGPVVYSSSPYAFGAGAAIPSGHVVTGRDAAGNTVDTPLTFVADDTGPTGGSLTVNGVAASAAGTTSTARATFPINARADFNADAGSGLAGSVLTRQSATLVNDSCGAFGGTSVLVGAPSQSGLTTGCYKYTLTGTDNVGNTSSVTTTVKYDVTAPTAAFSLASGTGASMTGSVLYYKSNAAGSFVLNAAVTDGQTSPASALFPAVTTAGWTHAVQTVTTGTGSLPTLTYTSSTYSWTSGAGRPPNQTITIKDTPGNTATSTVTMTRDTTVPTGGALTVNAVSASTAGSTSFNRTGSFTIGTRTDYTDAASGIASSTLTLQSTTLSGNTCGTYGAPSVLVGAQAQSGLTTGCYKFLLTGTDKVGNVVSRSTTVKVDLGLPTGGALTVNGTVASAVGTSSSSNGASYPIDVRIDWTDAASGLASSTLTRQTATYTAGACGTFGASTTLTGAPVQTGLATSCYKYTLTGTDNAGNATSVSTTVRYDITNPTTGALTVNGVAASAAGTTSASNGPSFTIGTRTDYVDANSGLASSTLTRQFAPLTGSACGTFGSGTVLVGAPVQAGLPTGCYKFVLTGVDNAGNTVSVGTTVSVGVYVTGTTTTNGTGTTGRVDAGDSFTVSFSDVVAVSTLCSTWSGDASDQVLNGDGQVVVTLTNGGAGNDTMTLSSGACTINLGSLNLGSTAYTTATVTFSGAGTNRSTMTWSSATHTLTVTLGAVSGAGPATVTSSTPVFTPSVAVTNPAGVSAGGTFTGAAARQF